MTTPVPTARLVAAIDRVRTRMWLIGYRMTGSRDDADGILEHANIRLPLWLDSLLVLVVSTPNMHKVHHSRAQEETDTNYSNLFSFFDRLFRTFTPSRRGIEVICGLDGFDQAATQTTLGLLSLPFRGAQATGDMATAVRQVA